MMKCSWSWGWGGGSMRASGRGSKGRGRRELGKLEDAKVARAEHGTLQKAGTTSHPSFRAMGRRSAWFYLQWEAIRFELGRDLM